MTRSSQRLPQAAALHNSKMLTELHTVESSMAHRIEANAAALRLIVEHGYEPGRRLLRALADDMEAWARELRSEPADMAAMIRREAA